MKMKNWVAGGSSVLALCLLLGAPQVALADFMACTELGVDNHVDGQVDCLSIAENFNDEGTGTVNGNINDIFGTGDILFGGDEEWMELGVHPDGDPWMILVNPDGTVNTDEGNGLIAGSFGISAAVFDMYDEVMLFFKDGQFGSTGVIIDPSGYSDVLGAATNFGVTGLGLSPTGCAVLAGDCYIGDFANMIPPGSGNQGAISHVNLWVRGAADVSEPGTLALLGLGLIATGFARRRKAA